MWRFLGASGTPLSIMPSMEPDTWEPKSTLLCSPPVEWISIPIERKSSTIEYSSRCPRRKRRNMRPSNFSKTAHRKESHKYLSHGCPRREAPRCGRGSSLFSSIFRSISAAMELFASGIFIYFCSHGGTAAVGFSVCGAGVGVAGVVNFGIGAAPSSALYPRTSFLS